jgi:hypothetical protein
LVSFLTPSTKAASDNCVRTQGCWAARRVWGLASEGLDSDGLDSEGLSSEGLRLSSEGLASEGLTSEGLASEGLASEGLATEGLGSAGLASEGLASAGLATAGLASADRAAEAANAAPCDSSIWNAKWRNRSLSCKPSLSKALIKSSTDCNCIDVKSVGGRPPQKPQGNQETWKPC